MGFFERVAAREAAKIILATPPDTSPIIDLKESIVSPIAVDNGNVFLQDRIVSKTIKMALFTTNENAVWASRNVLRKVSYPYAQLQLTVNRNLFRLDVGDCFKFSYGPYSIVNMICRVMSIREEDLKSENIVISAIEDSFSIANVQEDYTEPTNQIQNEISYTALPFIYQDIFESPFVLAGSEMELMPIAGRRRLSDLGYNVYMSVDDGASYSVIGAVSTLMPHGILYNAYSIDTYTIDDEVGFIIEFDFPEDMNNFESQTLLQVLSTTTNLAILGNELVSIQNITPDVDNRYILTGIIRGRYGTEKADYEAYDADFYFIQPLYPAITAEEIIPGVTRKFKLVPYNAKESGDISTAEEISLEIVGISKTPYKPINFLANGSSFASRYTDDIVLTWSPRYRGAGAGIGSPGNVLASTAREGLFRIEVFVSDVEVREITDIDAATWTYTEAMNLTDNGSLASSVTLKLYNFIEIDTIITYESDAVEVVCKEGEG